MPCFPNEIFSLILEQLGDDYHTLGRACLVCRQFRNIAQALLFREFRPSHDRSQDGGPGETIPILAKLLAEPRLAELVRFLQLDGAIVPAHSLWLDTPGQGKRLRDGLLSAESSGRVPSALAHAFNNMRQQQMECFGWADDTKVEETLPKRECYECALTRIDMTVSIIMVLCPNVEELSISAEVFSLLRNIPSVFQAARESSQHPLGTTNLFSRLRSLRFEKKNYEHGRIERRLYRAPQDDGHPIIHQWELGRPLLPASLESFRADTPALLFDWAMRPGSALEFPMYLKLRDLCFYHAAIPSGNSLRDVFKACPELQHLDLRLNPDLPPEYDVDPLLWDTFGRVLRKYGTKLHSFQLHTLLTWTNDSFLMSTHTSRIGSLRSLRNLRELVVPLDVLVGGNLDQSSALDQVLPRGLEDLVLSKSLLGAFGSIEDDGDTFTRKERAMNELICSKGDFRSLRYWTVM